jgi:flagellin
MRINNNLMAMNTHRQLGITNTASSKSTEKLSSGFRINRAGDDAAGLSISEKMRGQIRGLNQASRNSQDGISLIQTAEGALNETHAILQRMRELAVQSSNDTNTDTDRNEIQKEINQLTSEITRIGNNTEFNTKKVINGDLTGSASAGTQEAATIDFTAIAADGEAGTVKLNIGGTEYSVIFDASQDPTDPFAVDASNKTITIGTDGGDPDLSDLAAAFQSMRGIDPDLSLAQFDFSSNATGLTITARSTGDFAGAAGDGSIALVSGLDAGAITIDAEGANGADGSIKLQIGANKDQQLTVEIIDMRALTNLKVSGSTAEAAHSVVGDASFLEASTGGVSNALTDNSGGVEYALDVTSAAKATAAIKVFDDALATVSAERSKLGAVQNRLEHTIKNLDTSAENLQASESRIRDVDMAKEMMEFTKNNILTQAAQAMLAQANSAPQGVLQLLR